MGYCRAWVIYCLGFPTDAASQVIVFEIQEEILIESTQLSEYAGPDEHETSCQSGNFHGLVATHEPKLELGIQFLPKRTARKESSQNQIHRCRKQRTIILNFPAGKDYSRHNEANIVVPFQ